VTDQETDLAYELGHRIFARSADPSASTAIYAASDTTAMGLMQAAYQAGIIIPRDLSIVGFDDIDVAPFTIPPLTTISQAGIEMGEAAVELLMEMVEGGRDRAEVEDRVLEPRLVVRGSTAAPRSSDGAS